MHRLAPWLLSVGITLAFLTTSIIQASENSASRAREAQIIEAMSQLEERLLGSLEAAQDAMQEEISEAISELRASVEFDPYDIPMDAMHQEYAHNASRYYGVDPDLIFAIIQQETGYICHNPIMDSNGYWSTGYMMVNEINWDHLEGLGIDVHNPYGGLHAGIYLYAQHERLYGDERMALAAYNAGRQGMQNGGGMGYAAKVLSRKCDYDT